MRRLALISALLTLAVAGAATAGTSQIGATVKTPRKLSAFLKSGYPFKATAEEQVTYGAAVFVPKKQAVKWGIAKKTVAIADDQGVVGAGEFSSTMDVAEKYRRKLKALLRNDDFSKLPVVFQILAVDQMGNQTNIVTKKLALTG